MPDVFIHQGHTKSIQCLTVHRCAGETKIYSGSHDGHINILSFTNQNKAASDEAKRMQKDKGNSTSRQVTVDKDRFTLDWDDFFNI